MKKLNITIVLVLISLGLMAQTPEEALRYSRTNYAMGNAKATSMAGSLGSLGGNFAALSINPGGIGVYRSSEITFTPSVMYSISKSNYLSGKRTDEAINFNISNFGFVFAIPATGSAEKAGFRNFQFGLGINRTGNFKREVWMKRDDYINSITTQWVDDVNSYNNPYVPLDGNGNPTYLDSYSSYLAWDTYVLNLLEDEAGNPLYVFSDMEGGKVDQTFGLVTSGSMNEFIFSGGFNYLDKLYFGATFGIPYFTYREEYRIIEEDRGNINPYFQSMTYTTYLRTSGAGINFKVGAIYKPVNWLRIGLAVHTPTRYDMDDSYEAELSSYIDNDGNNNYVRRVAESGIGVYDYVLRTPMKLIGSLGFVIGQHGSVNVDYTFQDYSKAKFKSNIVFDETNLLISNSYKAGHSISAGTEWMFGVFRARAGYAYETSPYASKNINSGGKKMTIGAGVGLSFGQFYTDLGYALIVEDIDFYPYDRYYNPKAFNNQYQTNQFQLTFGFRF